MTKAAAVSAILFGLVSLAGGLQGYLGPAKSAASLIAGGISGVLLVAAGALALGGKLWALWLSAVVAVALIGRFLPIYLKGEGRAWPHLVMSVLGAAVVVVHVIEYLTRKS